MSSKKTAASNTNTDSKKKTICCCRLCAHAHLVQYGNNPIIAECLKKPNAGNQRFPYAVDVSITKKYCEMYTYRFFTEELVEHRPVRYTEFMKGELAA